MSIYIYGVIHIVRTHQGGGGDLAKAYAPYKKYHFSYKKCVLKEGGGGGIFDFVRTYYVNAPYLILYYVITTVHRKL